MIASAPLLRSVAVSSVAVLLVGWMVTADPVPSAAEAAPLAAGAETFRVSQTDQGLSTEAYLTSDAQHVAFTSTATDLVPGDTNGAADVFLSSAIPGSDDPFSGPAVLVSSPDASLPQDPANAPSSSPVAATEGRYVVFASSATNLAPGAAGPGTQIYVRDVLLGRTFRVQGTAAPDGSSYEPDVSDDGRYVVFTSEATNLSAGDTNGAPDGFLADLDGNGDGTYGDVAITRVLPDVVVPGGVTQTVISGNANRIVFTAGMASLEAGGTPGPVTGQYVYRWDRAWQRLEPIAEGHDPAVDSTGDVVAYVKDTGCDNDPDDGLTEPVVAVSTRDTGLTFTVAVGTVGIDRRAGYVTHLNVSANGDVIAWESTQPVFENGVEPVELDRPVIRMQSPSWWDASDLTQCSGILAKTRYDVGPGTAPTLSASGRTLAHSVPSANTPDEASVVATDTHSSDGLVVTSTQGEIAPSGFVAAVNTLAVPVSQLREYASALADAPIYRLPIYRLPIYRLPIYRLPIYRLMVDDAPIYRLPIYRLPIYRLPIYRLPIYRLAVPGGWTELLASTPYAGQLEQSVTLAEVLDWAAGALADGSGATAEQQDAARRIQALSLDDMDLTDSGIDALSLASMVLGGARLADVGIAGTGTSTQRWQRLVDAQGVGAVVDDRTVLADVDAAGLDIARSGVEKVDLNALPIDDTLFDQLLMKDLFLDGTPLGQLDIASLSGGTRTALFGQSVPNGTLAANKGVLLADATVADLAVGAPAGVTLGTLLFSILDAASYPWEQIDPGQLQSAATATSPGYRTTNARGDGGVMFRFTFDAGPGEDTTFAAPTATITMPAETPAADLFASGSGPRESWVYYGTYAGTVQTDGDRITMPLDDTSAGTMFGMWAFANRTALPKDGTSTATLTSGGHSATDSLSVTRELITLEDPTNNRSGDQWSDPLRPGRLLQEGSIYYEWISPAWIVNDDETGARIHGPAGDEDWFRVQAPPAGKRLIVSTNATDGQISMAMYAPSTGTSAAPLGPDGSGVVPGTPVTEQTSASVGSAESGADAGAEIAGQTLVDQAVVDGDGLAEMEAAGMDAAPGQELLIRVTSGDGASSSSLYSLRVRYVDEPADVVCTPRIPAQAAPGTSDPVTSETNTVYLLDTQRYLDTYGAADATRLRAALAALTGTGHVGSGSVQGAVLSVDSDPGVRAARNKLDANPCSMTARSALTAAINGYVAAAVGGEKNHISSVVIIGGDDEIPLAPVAQHTSQFNEASHAASLRLPQQPGGGDCPETVGGGALDPCATPISAAAATDHILTDDPYGLATAYQSLGGYLYVPNVGLGRLVGTSDQIEGAIARFAASDGVIDADSTLTGGYGAWSELPEQVTDRLDWRSGSNNLLAAPWGKATAESALFPAAGLSPRVVSLNTHADETRMLSGVPGAEDGTFTDADLLRAGDDLTAARQEQLSGALLFMIGCHAGNNLPDAYYGPVADWPDVFTGAAGFVGNTGYGLANNVTTALGERLLALYADWVGVTVDGDAVSTGASLQYAKQSYLGGLGLYSGYDEKALMEAVYYGLPMYTAKQIGATVKSAPLPSIADIGPVTTTTDPLTAKSYSSAGLSLALPADSFTAHTAKNDQGQDVTYFTVGDEAPVAIPGQPVLPKIVSQLKAVPGDLVPRGALITGLTTERSELTPAISSPTVGTGDAVAARTGAAFPSTFATVTRQETPTGPVDLLVVTPGRVETTVGGSGVMEKFTSLDLDVVYGPATSTDTAPPIFTTVEPPTGGSGRFTAEADGTGGAVSKMVLLVQPEDQAAGGAWRAYPMSPSGSAWSANIAETGEVRWILQAADENGNVAIDTARGRIGVAVTGGADAPGAPSAPTLGTSGGAAELTAGDRLLRTVTVTGAAPADLTAKYRVTDADGDIVSEDVASLTMGADGVTRATIDTFARTPGSYRVSLDVCRGWLCSTAQFDLDVAAANTVPSASVELSSDTDTVYPTSTLTANAVGDDDDGDPVQLYYEWFRNGVSLGQYDETVDLTGRAEPGDIISVTVTPSDPTSSGHRAFAEVEVFPQPVVPEIVATASNADGAYAGGTWSRSAVTVEFACTSGSPVISCPAPQTVSDDTTAAGIDVTGTMTDIAGQTATTSLNVLLDATDPLLDPAVTPSTVAVGGSATADPHATDAASGIASASCTAPDTATAGSKQVTCTATDVAGNTASATAAYTVIVPLPTITATAKAGTAPYVEGSWARSAVTVTFTCASGAAVVQCSPAATTSRDTGPAGVVVAGTVKDALGRTAAVRFLVKVDGTAPKLAPTVTPATVAVGGTAVAAANATDSGSGIASQSCDAPDTRTVGTRTVTCRATDAAGNAASATAAYTVTKATSAKCGAVADRTPLPPVNADGSSVFLRFSAVPVIFRACDASGKPIGTKGFVKGVTLVSTAPLPAKARVNEFLYPALRTIYIPLLKTWQTSIPTKGLTAGTVYTYRIALSDGTSFTVTFGVK